MDETPEVKQAVTQGTAVIACVYNGWVPDEIRAQLPENFRERRWAVEIVEGRIVAMQIGMPEKIVPDLLAQAPAAP